MPNANYTAELLAQSSRATASNATSASFRCTRNLPSASSHCCCNLMRLGWPRQPNTTRTRMAAAKRGRERSPPVRRTPHPPPSSIQHVRVDHRRAHTLVAEQFLHRADVVAVLEEMRR